MKTPAALSAALAVAIIGIFLAVSDPPLDPEPWTEMPPLRALDGPYEPNTLLEGATRLQEGEVLAPESFAVSPDGTLYGGLADGRVVAMDALGQNARPVFFSGGYAIAAAVAAAAATAAGTATGGKSSGSSSDGDGLTAAPRLMAECHKLAQQGVLHHDVVMERSCGRPLGLRWSGKNLYILDAYHGLFALDPATHSAVRLFDPNATVVTVPHASAADAAAEIYPDVLKRPRFLNDLAIASNGIIYMTDSSWKNFRAQNRREILDAGGRGRLLRLDPRTGKATTLLCGLHFPNGLEIEPSGERLLFVESMRLRILSVRLADLERPHPSLLVALATCGRESVSGAGGDIPTAETAGVVKEAGAGTTKGAAAVGTTTTKGVGTAGVPRAVLGLPVAVSIFTDRIPGFADNIRWDAKTGAYLVGIGTKISQPFSALHLLLRAPLAVRRAVGRLLPMSLIEKLVPRYGMVVAFGPDGGVRRSYHAPSGSVPFVSEVVRHPKSGFLFLGSHSNKFLARVRLP
ncbi:unnamed protein product [Phaeothamnion confervicola]